MEIINRILDETIILPPNSCIYDIETTGFDSKYNKVILIGVLYEYKSKINIKQFFASSLDDEKELLFYFKECIKDFDTLITYNGISFDNPFLIKRSNTENIDLSFVNKHHIDLLKIMKTHKNSLNLENCKLKTVEKLASIDRLDTITGKESVELYNEYLKTKSQDIKQTILLHNYEDIYYLAQLFSKQSTISKCIDESLIKLTIFNTNYTLYMTSFKISKNILTIQYLLSKDIPYPIDITHSLFNIIGEENKITLNINLKQIDIDNTKKMFFPSNNPILIKSNIPMEINIHTIGKTILKNINL